MIADGMMDRLSLKNERCYHCINLMKLFGCQIKTNTRGNERFFVCLLRFIGPVYVFLKSTFLYIRTTVANIWRLVKLRTEFFRKSLTGRIAFPAYGTLPMA